MEIVKLKKAHLVYFVQKDTPRRMDYRFNYERTPESALKYRIGQWVSHDYYSNRLVKKIFPKGYDTREEAEAVMSEYNRQLMESCPWAHYEITK
jgi:hypothetical protein